MAQLQGVNAIMSDSRVPMLQFTPTLRILCFLWHDSPSENICANEVVWFDYYIWVCMFCLLLYSVCPHWASQIN